MSLTVLFLTALWAPKIIKPDQKLFYNPSQSAEIGWYYVEPIASLSVGDLVVANLPEEAASFAHDRGYLPRDLPVIKTIGGIAGERYCIKDGELQIEERVSLSLLPLDSQGRALPEPPEMCAEISDGFVLLISERIAQSFDSRYFGEVAVSNIVGLAVYVGDSRKLAGRKSSGLGGARGLGAQGKIKGNSANWHLTPCLHITFYGANCAPIALILWLYTIDSRLLHSAFSRNFTQIHANLSK
jgi:conjugative transfer signal peptidase TraF